MKLRHFGQAQKAIVCILTLLYLSSAQFYSQRTKCSNNELSIDSQLSLFYQNTQYSRVNLTQIIDVMGMIKKLYHFGKKVDQVTPSNHKCQSYFMQQDICCRYTDLDQFTQKLVDLYKRTYYLSKHPMVDYIYKIFDQYKKLNPSCLNNYSLEIPERNGVTKQTATQPLGNLFSLIENQLSQIKQSQINFIYNSACVLCLGIQDLKTFIHPIHSDLKRTKRLIYNHEYFSNVTSMVATKMINSKGYADQIQSFIINQLRSRISSASECSALANLINDSAQISKRKVCDTFDQCLKFAQKYIGGPGSPAYSKVFTSIEQKRGITKTNYKIITSSQYGFNGNSTYQRYQGSYVPPVQIKGNDYTYA